MDKSYEFDDFVWKAGLESLAPRFQTSSVLRPLR